ncbi:hypothetical protein MDAP_002496 [Mitosporidium daphniae]
MEISHSQKIGIADPAFRAREDDSVIAIPNIKEQILFSWHGISVCSTLSKGTQRQILSNVSGWVKGGEMIAILGASGAGKSTLLNALVGLCKNDKLAVTGTIKLNGCDRASLPISKWKRCVGYVEQNDLLYPTLTVKETLSRMASLQLWRTLSKAGQKKLVSQIIKSLNLERCSDSLVGALGSGISGGEKKRLAIGLQLIYDPCILFLDEPTSGLDAHTSLQVVSTISEITADRPFASSKAVIMTIHQPRLNILKLFSRILLLSPSGGNCLFFGNIDEAIRYFDTIGFPCPALENPGDYFIDVIAEQPIPPFVVECPQVERQHDIKDVLSSELQHTSAPFFLQLRVLLWQNFVTVIRDRFMIFSIFFQALIFSLLIGFTVFQLPLTQPSVLARLGILFFLSVNTCFGIVQPIIIILPLEKGIVSKERFSNSYSSAAALVAKFCILLPLRIASIIFLSVLLWLLAGLHRGWDKIWILLGIMSSLTFAAVSLGLFIGAVSPSLKISQILAPLIISVFMIYGGNMSPAVLVSKPLAWLQYISPIRYAYTALCQNEFRGLKFSGVGYETGDSVLSVMDMDRYSIGISVLALICIGVLLFVVSLVWFTFSTRPRINLKIKPISPL